MSRILFKNGQVFYNNQLSKLDVLVEQDTIVDIKEEINDTNAVVIDLDINYYRMGLWIFIRI